MSRFAKVYYDHGSRFGIGPLGYWAVGDEPIHPDGTQLVVGSVDIDGLAVAWKHEDIERRAWDNETSFERELQLLGRVHIAHEDKLTAKQKEQCKGIAAAGARQRIEDEKRCGA